MGGGPGGAPRRQKPMTIAGKDYLVLEILANTYTVSTHTHIYIYYNIDFSKYVYSVYTHIYISIYCNINII